LVLIDAVVCVCDINGRQVIIIGSHHDKSALLFWSVARRLPVQEHPVVAWKLCHVIHKLMRDGHNSVSICWMVSCCLTVSQLKPWVQLKQNKN